MVWTELNDVSQLEAIQTASFTKPQLIFKHSTRCPISTTAKSRFERSFQPEFAEQMDFHLLDLIAFRSVSNAVATQWNVQHESPQLIFVQNGEVSYHESHYGITWEGVLSAVS